MSEMGPWPPAPSQGSPVPLLVMIYRAGFPNIYPCLLTTYKLTAATPPQPSSQGVNMLADTLPYYLADKQASSQIPPRVSG